MLLMHLVQVTTEHQNLGMIRAHLVASPAEGRFRLLHLSYLHQQFSEPSSGVVQFPFATDAVPLIGPRVHRHRSICESGTVLQVTSTQFKVHVQRL